MTEARETRVKRLSMRSMRRGMREMDLILQAYAAAHLDRMDEDGLAAYDRLLDESDQDLYRWISGAAPPPDRYADQISAIAAEARGVSAPR